MRDCFINFAVPKKCNANSVVDVGIIRQNPENLSVLPDSFGIPVKLKQRIP